jgi:catechol-2,3-dioxygenase
MRASGRSIESGKMAGPHLVGISHIELTVTDCARSAAWYEAVLGFRLMTHTTDERFEVYAMRHPSGATVDVMTHHDMSKQRFDERRVGLDHLSFEVRDRAEIERWVEHLDQCGVEHTGVIDAEFGATVVFRDPDNIQLELMVHPTTEQLAEILGQRDLGSGRGA